MSITQANTKRIIGAKGADVIWEKITGGTYSAATGKISGNSTQQYTIKGHYRNYRPKEISGILEQGDKELRSSTDVAFEPLEGDIVTIEGTDYRVMGVDNRLNKLYVVHVRGVR
jgi:hypothetical protein